MISHLISKGMSLDLYRLIPFFVKIGLNWYLNLLYLCYNH